MVLEFRIPKSITRIGIPLLLAFSSYIGREAFPTHGGGTVTIVCPVPTVAPTLVNPVMLPFI